MMRLPPRRALVVAMFALAVASGPGARAKTLDRRAAVAAALAQNPQIAASRAEEAVLEAQRAQVTAAKFPAIAFDAGIGPSLRAHLQPGTDMSVEQQWHGVLAWDQLSAVLLGNLSAIQPLYTFGKIALRGEAALAGLHARQAETRMKRADVAFAVAQIYEGFLYARDSERFFDEMDRWLKSELESTQDKVKNRVANASEKDILRIEASLGLSAMGLDLARAGEAQARAGLVAYLGLPANETVEVAEDEELPVGHLPADIGDLTRLARDNRPELAALFAGRQALAALGRAEHAGYFPDIFLMGFVNVAYTPGRDWVENRFILDPLQHFAPGAILGLHWQLQGGMAGARADEQHAHAESLARLGDWANEGIPAEVRKAWEDVRRCDQDLEKGDIAVKKAKKWMVEASADYDVGLGNIRELSDAVTSYVTLRMAVLKARYDRNVAMADLARATGTLDGSAELFYLEPPSAAEAPAVKR
jgi:outer membrane protein TolC